MKEEIRSIWFSRHTVLLGVTATLLVLFSIWD